MNRPRILVLSYSRLDVDPRVRRHLEALGRRWDVTAAGLSDPRMDGIAYLPISRRTGWVRRRTRFLVQVAAHRYLEAYWPQYGIDDDIVASLEGARPNLVLANDVETLPLAVRLKEDLRIPVVYDAHEFAPAQFDDRPAWRAVFTPFFTGLCEIYLRRIDAAFTVSPLIAQEYERRFGKPFQVLRNAPRYRQLPVRVVGRDTIRLVHHGGAISSRRIENMIQAAVLLGDGYRFDLYLVPTPGNPGYLERLHRIAAASTTIAIHAPLPYEELLAASNRCDVGLYALPPANLNQRYALPNKIFEFIQSRLAVVTGPSPEMAALVEGYRLGAVADDHRPASIARAVSSLSRVQIAECKRNADVAAKELSADNEYTKLIATVEQLMPGYEA